MERLKMETLNVVDENISKIGTIFPNCVTEAIGQDGKAKKCINFEMLRQMLSADEIEYDERFEFTWVGKRASIVEANTPIRKTLRPCKEESVNWDGTENLYIEGDNLDVLKLLQESYLEKVDLIFIDPPYNTGSDFIYPDNFTQNAKEYDSDAGMYDEDGNQMFRNTDANGRFHSSWCSMMYSRLLLARNLLSCTGSIFISIDDNEYANLKEMCDEIFGVKNFISTIIWENFYGRSNAAAISPAHNYILVYSKAGDAWKYVRNLLPRNEESTSKYKNPDNDPRGPWRLGPIFASGERHEGLMYTITTPSGKKVAPPKGSHWRMLEKDFWRMVDEGRILFGMDGSGAPAIKLFLSDVQSGMVPRSIWMHDEAGHSQEAKREIQALFPDSVPFDTPKPTKLLKQIITIGSDKDAIVMDFFAGSSSTADAVMQLNAETGSKRKYIMIQIPESISGDGYVLHNSNNTICEIGKERIRRAAKRILEESNDEKIGVDVGFRVLKVDESNMKEVYYSAEEYSQNILSVLESNIKPDRTDLDLLFGCLLEWGLPLSMSYSSEEIDGYTVHNYNDGDLIACFNENVSDSVIKYIAKQQPLRAVFRDSSFNGSPAKINVSEIFKLLAPDTTVKVI